jgi:hypothetical protein
VVYTWNIHPDLSRAPANRVPTATSPRRCPPGNWSPHWRRCTPGKPSSATPRRGHVAR